jgi:serine/threonine protein kinase
MNEPTQAPWLTERYIPQLCLGRKAGRQTWLAIDRVTGNPVVVKKLSFGRDFLWDDLKLFEREAQTLKSIDHPAIPTYLDFFDLESEEDQGFALVQSYIDARSLEEHVKSGRRFSEADLKEIAIQVLEILDYLHHCQPPVIHRDIKPSNILLAESDVGVGLVYLVDFGSVQSLAAREGSTITIVGTYGYMPPEQFGGRTYPTSDFYSLGATLIYLATGKHPADIPQGKDLRLNFEPLANLSLEMTEWIREMIHPLADERPNSARSAIQHLSNPSIQACQLTTVKPQMVEYPRPKSCRVEYAVSDNELNLRIPEYCIELMTQGNDVSISRGPTTKEERLEAILSLTLFFSCIITLLFAIFPRPEIVATLYTGIISILLLSAVLISLRLMVIGVQEPKKWIYLSFKNKNVTIDWDERCRNKNYNLKSSSHKISSISMTSYLRESGNGSRSRVYLIAIESNAVNIRIETSQKESRWLASKLGEFLALPITVI